MEKSRNLFWALMAALMLGASSPALAQFVPPDASDIVDTAESTFTRVAALIAAIVGFFIVVKIIKWIRH